MAQVKSLAWQLQADAGAPLSRWSCPELAREAVLRGIAETISASTVRRWLAADAIKPWQFRSWLFPRDPDFVIKAERVLDLYDRRWDGRRLEPGEYVIFSDEKTSIQARCRCAVHGPGISHFPSSRAQHRTPPPPLRSSVMSTPIGS